MHIVCVNYFYDHDLISAEALLERYGTLTGWAEGLNSAGARVTVIQRYSSDLEMVKRGVRYQFVRESVSQSGGIFDHGGKVTIKTLDAQPEVIHIHGLQYSRQASYLKRKMPSVPILVQDHAGRPPEKWYKRAALKKAFETIDGVSFSAKELIHPWIQSGILTEQKPLFELMEGSSRFHLKERSEAQAISRLSGDPLCLWVGRLDENKDPITVLQGFAGALKYLPEAKLAMVYDEEILLAKVKLWLKQNPYEASRITLLGKIEHAELENIFNSAQLFLSGSHHEGSGYAVIEALSCGVVPVLSDIPSFRVLTDHGRFGRLWRTGCSESLTEKILESYRSLTLESPNQIRKFFDESWSFDAIGVKAIQAYQTLIKGYPCENRNSNTRRI